jgi:hypothetical protein
MEEEPRKFQIDVIAISFPECGLDAAVKLALHRLANSAGI